MELCIYAVCITIKIDIVNNFRRVAYIVVPYNWVPLEVNNGLIININTPSLFCFCTRIILNDSTIQIKDTAIVQINTSSVTIR